MRRDDRSGARDGRGLAHVPGGASPAAKNTAWWPCAAVSVLPRQGPRQPVLSLTQVFDRPVHGREFFEEVIRDNLDIGRPDQVQLLFERRITKRTPGRFRTRVITEGVQPSLRFDYKQCRIKQYFKLERALRTETTFNNTYDFAVDRNIRNLAHLRSIGRNINRRLLTIERVAQNCAIASRTVEKIVLPTDDHGQHAPALRWGDPRTVALFAALCGFIAAPRDPTATSSPPRAAEWPSS